MFFVLFSLFAELEVIRITYFSWEPNDNPEQTMFKQFTNKDGHLVYVATGCGKKMLVAPYFLPLPPLPNPSIINLTTQSLGFLKRNKKNNKIFV